MCWRSHPHPSHESPGNIRAPRARLCQVKTVRSFIPFLGLADVVFCFEMKPFTVVLHEIGGVEIVRSEEHTSELQSQSNLVCRLLLEKKKCSQTARRWTWRSRNTWTSARTTSFTRFPTNLRRPWRACSSRWSRKHTWAARKYATRSASRAQERLRAATWSTAS